VNKQITGSLKTVQKWFLFDDDCVEEVPMDNLENCIVTGSISCCR
jgi:hypothetical protein